MSCCEALNRHINEGEVAVIYVPKFREYGIQILDGGSSFQEIYYCPWCGSKLPESLRDEWFDKLEELGLEPEDENVPVEMQSGAWWQTKI